MFGNLIYYSQRNLNVVRYENTGGGYSDNKYWLYLSVIVVLCSLIYFKYFYIVLSELNGIFRCDFEIKKLVVPLGFSFLSFSAISYVVDISRSQANPGKFFDALLYFLFFPKFISGPIVLWKDFSSLLNKRNNSFENVVFGIERFIIGLSKKVIFADTFAECISRINEFYPNGLTLLTLFGRSVLFMFQIYLDFSAYSDMAIGMMKIFGFESKENFNFPYISQSVSEFWRRWHISLGTFFKEYVYIPLGGNRRGNVYINLFVVFALTGIWHGVGLNFLIWGGLNGIFVCFERFIKDFRFYKAIPKFVKIFITLFILYLLWVIFMNKDFISTLKNFKYFANFTQKPVNFSFRYFFDTRIMVLLIIASLGFVLYIIPYVKEKVCSLLDSLYGTITKYIILVLLFIVSVSFICNSTYHPFIYFQF